MCISVCALTQQDQRSKWDKRSGVVGIIVDSVGEWEKGKCLWKIERIRDLFPSQHLAFQWFRRVLGDKMGHGGGRAGGVEMMGWFVLWWWWWWQFGQGGGCELAVGIIKVGMIDHGGGHAGVVVLARLLLLWLMGSEGAGDGVTGCRDGWGGMMVSAGGGSLNLSSLCLHSSFSIPCWSQSSWIPSWYWLPVINHLCSRRSNAPGSFCLLYIALDISSCMGQVWNGKNSHCLSCGSV